MHATAAGIACAVATAVGCAGVTPTAIPACGPAEEKPLPAPACELGAGVEDWKRDAALTFWGYAGEPATRLPVVIAFDERARVDSVCVDSDTRVPRSQRKQVDRGLHALRVMRRAPACLAGTRLELAEDLADAGHRVGSKRTAIPRVDEDCAGAQPRCTGWREPVCALLSDGERETYPDACQACADPHVRGYDEGSCPIAP